MCYYKGVPIKAPGAQIGLVPVRYCRIPGGKSIPHLEKGNISTDFKCIGAKYPFLLLLYVDTKGTQSRCLVPKLEHVPLV